MEKIKPTKLAIAGKVIDISKIGEKTLAQFRAQLKQNGVTIEEDSLERLYVNLRGELTEEQKAMKAEAEAKAAEMKAAAEAKAAAAKKSNPKTKGE